MHQDVGRGAVIFFREGEGRIGTSDWSLQIESKKSKHGLGVFKSSQLATDQPAFNSTRISIETVKVASSQRRVGGLRRRFNSNFTPAEKYSIVIYTALPKLRRCYFPSQYGQASYLP